MEFWKPVKLKRPVISQSYWRKVPVSVPIWQQRNDDKRLAKSHGPQFTSGAWHVDKNPKFRKLLKYVKTPIRVLAAKNIRNVKSGNKFAAAADYDKNEIWYNKDMRMTLKEKQRMIAHELGHFKLREKGVEAHKDIGLSRAALLELRKTKMYKHIKKEGYAESKIPEEAFSIFYQNLRGPDMTPEMQERFKKKFPILYKEFIKLANGHKK